MDEQKNLNYMGWKYAARLKAYTRLMEKVHNFIVDVRKAQKKDVRKWPKGKGHFRSKGKGGRY